MCLFRNISNSGTTLRINSVSYFLLLVIAINAIITNSTSMSDGVVDVVDVDDIETVRYM